MDLSPSLAESVAQPPGHTVQLTESFYLQSTLQTARMSTHDKPIALNEISDSKAQEALVVKDLLLALLGYEGSYMKFSERYDSSLLHDRIHGPDHKVAKHLDISLKAITKRVLRYGKYYSGISNFAQIYDSPLFGRVNQRLCLEINRFCSDYRLLVLSFEESFISSPSFSITSLENELNRVCADNMKHLYDICCAIHSETENRNPRFRHAKTVAQCEAVNYHASDPKFGTFLESVRNDITFGNNASISSDPNRLEVCKGGLVLTLIQNRSSQYKGDAVSVSFISALFEAVSVEYVALLNLWLSEGKVNDPFQEFFVKKNDLPKNIFYSNMERYWEELYVIKLDGLVEQFTSKETQSKVLTTGKYLNIFTQCLDIADIQSIQDDDTIPKLPAAIESLCAPDVNFKISQFYERANNLLLKLFFQGYKFGNFLVNLHKSYLLCDSFYVDIFLEKSLHELGKSKKSASTIVPINLFNELFRLGEFQSKTGRYAQEQSNKSINIVALFQKFSIDANNFYDIAEEIINIKSFDASDTVHGNEQASSAIKKLVTQSLQRHDFGQSKSSESESSDGILDAVITGVNIDIDLPFPINLMISENFIFEYQLIFKLQMILKYTSKLAEAAWRDTMFSTVWTYKNRSSSVRKLKLRMRVLISRMKALVTELQSYVNYSVIESNFKSLSEVFAAYNNSTRMSCPTSRSSQSASPLKSGAHLFMKHGHRNNNIFDEKISDSNNRQAAYERRETGDNYNDFNELHNHIGTYLNNILRDSMITNSRLLANLRTLLGVITEFTSITTRLKKTLISIDAELLEAFARDYPEKFSDIEYTEALAEKRITGLSEVLSRYWSNFDATLQDFIVELQNTSTENNTFAVLRDKFSSI